MLTHSGRRIPGAQKIRSVKEKSKMQIDKVHDWLQIAAAIAVVVGLYLVIQEIRQNNDLARAATINSLYSGWEVLSMSEYESGIQELFIKSIENPDDLSPSEIAKLDSYLTAVTSLYGRQWAMYREYDLAFDPTVDTEFAADFYFGGRFARAWFQVNRVWLEANNPEMTRVLSREIESNPLQTEYVVPKQIRSKY